MSFCHYIEDRGDKILIPYCYSVVMSGDIEDCICPNPHIKNKEIRVRQNEIDRLQREIDDIKLKYDLKLKG